MIIWRDVRSQAALKDFLRHYARLSLPDQQLILGEMRELLEEYKAEHPIMPQQVEDSLSRDRHQTHPDRLPRTRRVRGRRSRN